MRPRLPEKPVQRLFPDFHRCCRQRLQTGALSHKAARRFHHYLQPVSTAKVRIRVDAAPVTALQFGAQPGLTETLFPSRKEAFSPGEGQRLPCGGSQGGVHIDLSLYALGDVCKSKVSVLLPTWAVIPKAAQKIPSAWGLK